MKGLVSLCHLDSSDFESCLEALFETSVQLNNHYSEYNECES